MLRSSTKALLSTLENLLGFWVEKFGWRVDDIRHSRDHGFSPSPHFLIPKGPFNTPFSQMKNDWSLPGPNLQSYVSESIPSPLHIEVATLCPL